MIPTEGRIPSTDKLFIEPASIRSSGSSMYIIVSADTSDKEAVVDYVRPDGCSSTALSINQEVTLVTDHSFVAVENTSCYYVIHANDPTNSPLLTQNVQISDQLNTGWFSLYKGLLMNDKRKLVYNELLSKTSAYDKYLIVVPTQTSRLSFDYSFAPSLNTTLEVRRYSHGTIMSNDYYKDSYPDQNGAMKQNIVIEKIPPSKVFQITFLNMMGPGTLSIVEITDDVTVGNTVYLPASFGQAFNNTYDCDKVILKYSTKFRPASGNSGFYAVYEDATDYTVYPSTTPKQMTTTGKQLTSQATAPPVNPTTSAQLSTTNSNSMPTKAQTSTSAPTGPTVVSSSIKVITQRPIITTQSPVSTTKKAAEFKNIVFVSLISIFVVLL